MTFIPQSVGAEDSHEGYIRRRVGRHRQVSSSLQITGQNNEMCSLKWPSMCSLSPMCTLLNVHLTVNFESMFTLVDDIDFHWHCLTTQVECFHYVVHLAVIIFCGKQRTIYMQPRHTPAPCSSSPHTTRVNIRTMGRTKPGRRAVEFKSALGLSHGDLPTQHDVSTSSFCVSSRREHTSLVTPKRDSSLRQNYSCGRERERPHSRIAFWVVSQSPSWARHILTSTPVGPVPTAHRQRWNVSWQQHRVLLSRQDHVISRPTLIFN